MITIQTKFLKCCFSIVLLLFTGCLFQKPCSERVVVEIPITAQYGDTLRVGDTILYQVVIPDELVDLESNTSFDLPDDFALGIELSIDNVDDRDNIGRHFGDFDILPIRGNIEIRELNTGLQFGRLEFEQADSQRSVELSIVLRQQGRYGITLGSPYFIDYVGDERFFTKETELFGGEDCSEELNLVFSLNGGTTRGYEEYSEAVSWVLDIDKETYQNGGVLFVTVVD